MSKSLRFGWVPDLPDHRDHLYAAPARIVAKLPSKVDLRPLCPPVLDQGDLGSCTANAISNAHRFDQMKQKKPSPFTPSRLFIYYNERTMEHTINSDAGAQIRDGIKSIAKQGVCPETQWPYDVTKFAKKPPAAAFTAALKNQALSYRRLTPIGSQLKGCIAEGFPFVFGITVYESFESDKVAKTGKVPLPATKEKCLGGHAILGVGYDDSTQCFTVMNSWGPKWGDKGFFYLPYAYATDPNLASDFWTVQIVEA
ncbi:MAG: peptidase [Rhodocyclales bacterium]|nr:peptidase [Rhodocyclales bacterium]